MKTGPRRGRAGGALRGRQHHEERRARSGAGRQQRHLHPDGAQRRPEPASAVTVSDPLPAGLTLVSASSTTRAPARAPPRSAATSARSTPAPPTTSRSRSSRPPARARSPSVTNTATVSTSTADPSAANNQASAQTTVNPAADLSSRRPTRPTRSRPAPTSPTRSTVHNAGPSPAAGVSVSDPLPAGLTLVSASSTQGTCSGTTTVSCDIGTVNAGSRQRRDGHDRRDRGRERGAERHEHRHGLVLDRRPERRATTRRAPPTTVDPVGRPAASPRATRPTRSRPAATSPTRSRSTTPARAPPSGVSVSDPLPAGLTLVSASSTQGTCSGTATISCAIGTVNAGAASDVTVTIVATRRRERGAERHEHGDRLVHDRRSERGRTTRRAPPTTREPGRRPVSSRRTTRPIRSRSAATSPTRSRVHNAGPSPASGGERSPTRCPAGLTLVSATATRAPARARPPSPATSAP